MDPITLLQTISAATEVASICVKTCGKIYEFTRAVRNIDKTLARIEDEVSDLENILSLVKIGISDAAVTRRLGAKSGEWMSSAVGNSVTRSSNALTRLKRILDEIQGTGSGQTTIVALRQTVKSKRKSQELTECIAAVSQTKLSLNVSLSMLGVWMVANTPQYRKGGAEADIEPLTKELESALGKAKKSRDDAQVRRAANTVLQEVRSPRLSRSSTLVASQSDDEDDQGSLGDNQSSGLEEPIAQWIRLLQDANETRNATLGDSADDIDSDESPDQPLSESVTGNDHYDEIFQIELVEDFIARGQRYYYSNSNERALEAFQQAIDDAMKLSKRGRNRIERALIHVRLNIAELQIASTRPFLDVAEENALQVILAIKDDRKSPGSEVLQNKYRAYYILAKVYFRSRDYEEAESYCCDALNIRRSMNDKSSTEYWQANQLLVHIFKASGMEVKVAPLLEKMPSEWRTETRTQLFGSSQNAAPPTPRVIGRVNSEPSIPVASLVSHKAGATTSPRLDTGTFETLAEELDLGRKSSLPDAVNQVQATVLAHGGFKGDFDTQKALEWAIAEGKIETVSSLLSGLQVTKKRRMSADTRVFKCASLEGTKGCSALLIALSTPDRARITQMLLNHGAQTGQIFRKLANHSPLEIVAEKGFTETTEVLFEHNLAINSSDAVLAFALAAKYGHLEVLKLFVNRSIAYNRGAASGRTALYWAAWCGNEHCVRYLLQIGAEPDSPDEYGFTPLMVAARDGHESSVVLLLSYGADVDAQTGRKQSALTITAAKGRVNIAAELIRHQANVDARDSEDRTPLIWACDKKHLEMVKLLLNAKARVNAQCVKRSRALDYVKNRAEFVTLLKDHDAQLGSQITTRGGPIDDPFRGYVLV